MSILGDGINAINLLDKTIKEINLAFGFKTEDNVDKTEAVLSVLNLDEEVAPLVINSHNIKIHMPINKEGTDWDCIDRESNSERNCWLRVPSYLKEKNTAKICFEINDKDSWISFYNLRTRRTIKVYFEKDNENWKYKVGKFNFFTEAKN